MEQPRLIRIVLRSRQTTDSVLRQQEDQWPTSHAQEQYSVLAEGYQTISKLFRVNQESRDAALAFYRVRIPSWFIKRSPPDVTTTINTSAMLYLNPEHDIIHVSNPRITDDEELRVAHFFHDLKYTYDARNVGLLNLAVDSRAIKDSLCAIQLTKLSPEISKSFTETLSQLCQVFFVAIQSFAGRVDFGYWTNSSEEEEDENKHRFNPSFPLQTRKSSFDRLPYDPRPINDDLETVLLTSDPHWLLDAWHKFFAINLGGRAEPPAAYRFILACGADNVYDFEDAQNQLSRYEQVWTGAKAKVDDQVEGLSEGAVDVKAVYGYWILPVSAFALPYWSGSNSGSSRPFHKSLTEYSPELALVNLSKPAWLLSEGQHAT